MNLIAKLFLFLVMLVGLAGALVATVLFYLSDRLHAWAGKKRASL